MKKSVKILIGIGIITFLVIAWYLASPLFLNKTVDEDFPIEMDSQNVSEENMVVYSGSFMDADNFHKAMGEAKIISEEDKMYLRLENFETTNGPDLYVYLASDTGAEDFVNLGRLKGNIGNQNYEISEEINLEKYDKVLIWCKAFSVLFGSADLEVSGN